MRKYREGPAEVHAIVPVKTLRLAKTRLAPVLNPAERTRFSVAMLVDVLEALRKVKRLHRVTVVSPDRSLRRIARSHGANWLWEGKRRGLNNAVRLAIRDSKLRGASATLIIPADIPLVTPSEILDFLSHAAGYAVALNPSKDGAGTNALLTHPPGVMRPVFGRDSFRKHLALAERRGLSRRVIRAGGISFDVDEPKDLKRLMNQRVYNETGRFLSEMRCRSQWLAER